jgi:hypothetical protein
MSLAYIADFILVNSRIKTHQSLWDLKFSKIKNI